MADFYVAIPEDTDSATPCMSRAPAKRGRPQFACTRAKGHSGPHACEFAVWSPTPSAPNGSEEEALDEVVENFEAMAKWHAASDGDGVTALPDIRRNLRAALKRWKGER